MATKIFIQLVQKKCLEWMQLDDQIDVKNKSLPNSLLLNFKNKNKNKFRIELKALCIITTNILTEGYSTSKAF